MTGVLSKMFESADPQSEPAGAIGEGGAGALHQGQDLDADFHARAEIQLHAEASGEWQDLGGDSHGWSREMDAGAQVDSDTMLGQSGVSDYGVDDF